MTFVHVFCGSIVVAVPVRVLPALVGCGYIRWTGDDWAGIDFKLVASIPNAFVLYSDRPYHHSNRSQRADMWLRVVRNFEALEVPRATAEAFASTEMGRHKAQAIGR